MNNLQEIIKSIKKQNQLVQKAVGLSSLASIVDSIQKMNKVSVNLAGLGGISEIARNLAMQKEKFSAVSILSNSLTTQMATLQMPKNNFALSGLTSSLSQLAVQNKLVSDKLANLATSQLVVTGNLVQIAKTMQQSHLDQFNTLSVALQGI